MSAPSVFLMATLAATLFLASCNGSGRTIHIDGRRPETTGAVWHISWRIERDVYPEWLPCAAAGAVEVLALVTDAGQSRTYKMACDLPGSEAWIPIERGEHTIQAKLMDASNEVLSKTEPYRLEVNAANDHPTTPVLFLVK